MTKNVLLIESNPMEKRLLELYFDKNEQYELICSIQTAEELGKYCKNLSVDVIVAGLSRSDFGEVLNELRNIKEIYPNIKIIVSTSLPECSFLEWAKENKADGFWYKNEPLETLLEIIDKTVGGEIVYPEKRLDVQIGNCMGSEMTSRELQVLREVVCGATDTEITDKLHISLRTVKCHIQNMREKTGFRNRTELAVHASTSGLVLVGNKKEEKRLHESTMCENERFDKITQS